MVKNLLKAIEIAVQQGVLEKLAQKTQQQELELLRYKERYHSTQQEMAFMKELKIIKNDLLFRKIDHLNINNPTSQWHIDVCYIPLDILSGDSYSIREIAVGKILILITDAMGKGLSASVTSILTTSFINHIIDEMIGNNNFDFNTFLNCYIGFIKKELLKEEIFCASFIYIDFNKEYMDTALFAMPPILIYTNKKELLKIKSNNMPIMKYLKGFNIDRHDISNLNKLLFYSDGLNEGIIGDDEDIYQEYLENDFISSSFKDDLLRKFTSKVSTPEDDVTFILLKRIKYINDQSSTFIIDTKLEEVIKLVTKIEHYIYNKGIREDLAVPFINSLNEIIMNAYEHGNLGINFEQKIELIASGEYENYLMNKENQVNKKIKVIISLNEESDKTLLISKVQDEGNGFDLAILNEIDENSKRFSGRGIKIAKTLTDILLYNKTGNEALLMLNLNKGE
ncbi:response regulator receiver domain-containing protein [Candidatus Magnetoovum chiemensis]|nr:response regulator receiver domain-containing protein [Candidatus Magnetoovum chiemensis]